MGVSDKMLRPMLVLLLLAVVVSVTGTQFSGFHYPFAPFYPTDAWGEFPTPYNRQARAGYNNYFRTSKRGLGSESLRFVPQYLKMYEKERQDMTKHH